MLEQAASLVGAVRVDGRGVLLDVPDNPFLVDYEGHPVREPMMLVEYPVLFGDGPLEVAQQREGQAFLLGEDAVGSETVNTDAEDLRPRLLEFGDISLIRLELLRSTPRESQHVERQDDVLLAQEVAQLHWLAALVR